jgi:hypothetical protein
MYPLLFAELRERKCYKEAPAEEYLQYFSCEAAKKEMAQLPGNAFNLLPLLRIRRNRSIPFSRTQ